MLTKLKLGIWTRWLNFVTKKKKIKFFLKCSWKGTGKTIRPLDAYTYVNELDIFGPAQVLHKIRKHKVSYDVSKFA